MKLNPRKIHWIIRQKQKGVTTKQIALDMKISRRRVQQIWKIYVESKQDPAIGESMGRPRKPFDDREAQVVSEGYRLYRFGARMLGVAVRKVFKVRISHNCIHMYLKAAKDATGDVFCHWPQAVWAIRGNMNSSHEMKSEQVRNTFRTLQTTMRLEKSIYLKREST
jgi:hypothetical protein